ncbi:MULTISPECIES: ParA family protein [Pantoea]|uniref:ParA family protein n=1 Tax=Pantoea TaxID=53335 RepID=UPI000DA666FB|nr:MULTISPECIES: ParA family protein [Pantoea]MDF7786066.1 ParA family protein [Pantoea stewartii]PZD63551.1 chromosome partitioning protein [Pantoea ananatis]
MAVVVSMINMKGGVGKTTLTFNLAWYSAWIRNLKVLVIDLDPQANLSQYLMGAEKYLKFLNDQNKTVVEIFEQYSSPDRKTGSPVVLNPDDMIHEFKDWDDESCIHLVASSLELAWTLKNPTEKASLLPQFISKVADKYDLILIDCAPTESILTTAAYLSSRYIFVPVKPEFLATIGLPLLARSVNEYKLRNPKQSLDMAGIVFNDSKRTGTSPEHIQSINNVKELAKQYKWPVLDNQAYHSDSYPTGSRDGSPIFRTKYARDYVKDEFDLVAEEFLNEVGL